MMQAVVVTGSNGLIGAETVRRFVEKNFLVVGIDNDMRQVFFGEEASTAWLRDKFCEEYPSAYHHFDIDIRNDDALERIFGEYGSDIVLVIHAAAQPSHDWAARDPKMDFGVNAVGTLNLLEAVRTHCRQASFIYLSTNKVYGDTPNRLPVIEQETRYEISPDHHYFRGIDESMSIDQSVHSLFGVSKTAADLMVQEYGQYFGMNTVVFRGGCLTGGFHSGAQLHGFLSYLVKCNLLGIEYSVFGYKGKQVRDNIHSFDLVRCFEHYHQSPRKGAVYNIGGGRHSNCSVIEAFELCRKITGKPMRYLICADNRIGDHQWYISDVGKFMRDYPDWTYSYDIEGIIKDILQGFEERL